MQNKLIIIDQVELAVINISNMKYFTKSKADLVLSEITKIINKFDLSKLF